MGMELLYDLARFLADVRNEIVQLAGIPVNWRNPTRADSLPACMGRDGHGPRLADRFVGHRTATPSPVLFKRRKIWHGWTMTTVTLKKAQQDLPILVKRALAGEEIVIEASQAAAVRLAPISAVSEQAAPPSASYRGRGVLKGQLVLRPEFFEPLTDEESGVAAR